MAQKPPSSSSAREQARKLQQEQERKQKMNSMLLRVGVIIVALAVVVGIGFFIVTNDRDNGASAGEGPAPAVANEYGGIVATSATELADGDDVGTVDTQDIPDPETEGLPDGIDPEPAEGEPLQLVIYADAACPHCATFEQFNAGQIKEWVDQGAITVEYRLVGFLDGNSTTNYSSRAASAATCVAEASPENYLDYVADVISRGEQGELSNDELAGIARDSYGADIDECVDSGEYRAFTTYTTRTAQANDVSGTPDVYLGGQNWADSGEDFQTWASDLIEAHGGAAGGETEDAEAEEESDAESDAEGDTEEEAGGEEPAEDENTEDAEE